MPDLVVIVGAPGAGKTTLGAALARELRAALVDRDSTMGALAAAALEQAGMHRGDLDSPLGKILSAAGYLAAEEVARDNLRTGTSVILVAPYSSRSTQGWAARLEALGAPVHVIWCEIHLDQIPGRLRSRGAARDAATLASWDRFTTQVNLRPPTGAEHLRITPDTPPEAALQIGLGWLARRMRHPGPLGG